MLSSQSFRSSVVINMGPGGWDIVYELLQVDQRQALVWTRRVRLPHDRG